MSAAILSQKIKEVIVAHWSAIIMAAFFSFLVSAPLVFFPLVAGDEYKGVNIQNFGGDEYSYISRGKEVAEGHNTGNSALREGKNGTDWFFTLNDKVLFAPIRFFGLSDVNFVAVYNIYNFVGVFLLLLLIYRFVFLLSKDKLLSILCASFVIGGYSIVYNKRLFFDDFIMYGRAMYPFISSIFFFLYLNLLVQCLKNSERRYAIFAGLSFGYLFYVYFYAWSFALALNGLLAVLLLCRKNFQDFKKILFISVFGIAIGLYNLIKLTAFMNSDLGREFSYFMWSSYARTAVFSKIGLAALVLFVFYAYKKRTDDNLIFIFALILTGWVALNQQLITGRMLQYGHYYWYFIVPLGIIAMLYMFWFLLKKRDYQLFFFGVVLFLVVLNATVGQYRSFLRSLSDRLEEQNYAPIISVLKQDKTPGVILAKDRKGLLFTLYTPHDLFWDDWALVASTPDKIQRIKDVLFVYLSLNKESRDDFSGYLDKIMSDEDNEGFYKEMYISIEGYDSGFDYRYYRGEAMNDETKIGAIREKVISDFAEEYKTKTVREILQKYGVNYILWEKNKDPAWDLSIVENKKEVFSRGDMYLYRVD